MQHKTKQQQKRLSANVRQAKDNKVDLKKLPKSKNKTPPAKQPGGISSSLTAKIFGRADKPQSAQQSIPYREIFRDGICRVNDRLYTKTIVFYDINYHLAQNEDKNQIFENYCDFLNYFDSSINVQISCINQYANIDELRNSITFPEGDAANRVIMEEYTEFIRSQQAKGNNGLLKAKYVTFGIQADNLKAAKLRIERVEADILNNFKVLGVLAHSLNGTERLEILHNQFYPDGSEKFIFNWKDIVKSGLNTKDYIAPTSFDFHDGKIFKMGEHYGAISFLQILAPELRTS